MMDRRRRLAIAKLRRRVHLVLDSGVDDRQARLVHGALIGLVALSVASIVLESDAALAVLYGPLFHMVEFVAVGAFTIEYGLRIWCAPEHTPYAEMSSSAARRAFIRSGSAIIDLLTILTVYLSFVVAADLRILLFLRLLRYLKLARYSPGMRSLIAVLQAERKALAGSAIILFGAVLFMAAAMYTAEREAQPESFGSIPAAMWWAIQTIATVGYGDVVPETAPGRIVAALAMVTGFVMLGLPVGIVATAFAEEIHRRDFVVTWSMVARVPLFASLDASAIAEIMRYLRAQSAPAGTLIVRRGEVARCMYFIAVGEVEIELPRAAVRLGAGQFFGEMALLRETRRTANVRAIEPAKLLLLDASDLHTFMQRNPEIGRRIKDVAASRAEFAPQRGQGDIIASEIEDRDNAASEPTQ
ncbi:MAG: ion transporter [Methylocystis sp.]|nr:ion transporter [Methylocystis sp.]MBI3275741.1 ion transporter [Methylocystis sp.]